MKIPVFSRQLFSEKAPTYRRRAGFFIDNFEYILQLFLVFLRLTLKKQMLAGFLLFIVCSPVSP